ncbi:MAG: hypothetical protein SF182_04285 [Deltaproteobacteria bacterium]|nr:hypothetical protein [Deltaproteobacteria bacterium]
MTRVSRLLPALCLLLLACGSDDGGGSAATPTPVPTATPTPNPLAQACVDAGGTVTTRLCCSGQSDFPSTCGIGACGCSPAASRLLPLCECPDGSCWNGTDCAARGS